MHKKKIIFIIILLALLSFVSASYEVKGIELSNRQIKEISDTHNEVS